MVRLAEEHYRKRYPVLRVYRDDLEHIVAIVKQHCNDGVTIRVGKYEVDSVGDLDSLHMETLPSFEVDAFMRNNTDGKYEHGMLSIRLKGLESNVYVSDTVLTPLLGAATQIGQRLEERKPALFDKITSKAVMVVGAAAFFIVAAWAWAQPWKLFSVPHPTPGAGLWFALSVSTLLLAALWPFIIGYVRAKGASAIYMTYSHERKSFWKRNRDAILLALISGVIGLVTGVICTLIGVVLTRP